MVSLMPGLHEVAEALEHLVHDGHLPHSEQHNDVAGDEAHQGTADTEHGCTPMSHQCECHSSVVVLVGEQSYEIGSAPAGPTLRRPHVEVLLTGRANAPPTPPPLA